MKTNNDYQMFFQGYLEALTDIDGDQREFGIYVKMFNSSNKDHLLDIQKKFGYKEPIEVIQSKKFRNFYSIEFILRELIFVKFFNGAKVPKKSLESFRNYVIFHLMDYIDFSFDDAQYTLGRNKKFELIVKHSENINTIFLVMSANGKKLIMRFYRNKKYISDKKFDKWVNEIIDKEEQNSINHIKKRGITEYKIHSFLYKDYDKKEILESAYEISICSPIKSKYIEQICTKEKWKLKKLISLYAKGIDEIYGTELRPIKDIAKWRVVKAFLRIGYKEEYKFNQRIKDMLKAIKIYNKRFETEESLKRYLKNNKYGYAISPDIDSFLRYFEKIIHKHKTDEKIATVLMQKYKKENIKEVYKAIVSLLKKAK